MSLGLDENGLIDNELANALCCDELRVAIVNDLVDDLVDEDEVLANALFIQDAAIVSKDLHHAINDVQDGRWGDVRLACCHEVDAELLREEVVNTVHML